MTEYVRLESILTRIPKNIREQESEGNLLSYALDIYKELNIPQKYETKFCLLTIVDHHVKIPDDVKIFNMVTYQNECPTQQEACELLRCADEVKCSDCGNTCPDLIFTGNHAYCSSCNSCLTEPENFMSRTNNICRHTLNYQLFLVSQYYANNFEPLKYIGTGSGICKRCEGRNSYCQHTFKVSPSRVLWTDIQEGLLCIDYDAEVTENGHLLIPNHPKLIRAMATYAEALVWKNKRGMHEDNAHNFYKDMLIEAEILLKSAKGDFILKAADANAISRVIFTGHPNHQFLKVPEFYYAES